MHLTRRLIAPIVRFPAGGPMSYDLGAFVRRLFLFDHYVLTSVRLLEIPVLVEAFGLDGLIEILDSGAVSLDCFTVQTASLGPGMFVNDPAPKAPRPPFHYSLASVSLADVNQHINLTFPAILPSLNLSSRQTARLRKAIHRALAPIPDDPGALGLESTVFELSSSAVPILHALPIALSKKTGTTADIARIRLELQPLPPHDFKAASNLETELGLTRLLAHQVIESAILAIAHRNDRIEQMKHHHALIGFDDEDLPIFGQKLAFLQAALAPERAEDTLRRVVEVRGLPSLPPDQMVKLDARKLLALRASPECIEIRKWLETAESMTDEEIARYGRSLSSIIGSAIRSPAGRAVRFLATSALGLIPGAAQVIGIPLSAVDQFLLDHIIPSPGPATLIDAMYPSIFE